jgi:alcohol dehydrogenase
MRFPPGLSTSSMNAFDHQPRTRLVFGVDAVQCAGQLARELGATCVLLVTDPGIVAAGHATRVVASHRVRPVS